MEKSKSIKLSTVIGCFMILNFCQPILVSSEVIKIISVQDWDNRIGNGNSTLIVAQFHVPWCGYCQYMKPRFARISTEYTNNSVIFLNVDADEQQTVAWRMGIRSVPTYKYFKNGQNIDSVSTWRPSVIRDLINRLKN